MSSRSARPSSPMPAVFRSPMTWLLVVVVIAVVVVFTSSDDGDDGDAGPQTAPVEITGDVLPPYTEPDTATGLSIPTVEASLLGGGAMRIEAGDGTPRLIGFFAHWCPHCQAEVPTVGEWLRTNPLPGGVQAVAVSTAVDSRADNYPPSDWFARENWPTRVLLDDDGGSIAGAFGLTAFPFWVATDAQGTVVARMTGNASVAQLEAMVSLAAASTAP